MEVPQESRCTSDDAGPRPIHMDAKTRWAKTRQPPCHSTQHDNVVRWPSLRIASNMHFMTHSTRRCDQTATTCTTLHTGRASVLVSNETTISRPFQGGTGVNTDTQRGQDAQKNMFTLLTKHFQKTHLRPAQRALTATLLSQVVQETGTPGVLVLPPRQPMVRTLWNCRRQCSRTHQHHHPMNVVG